MLEEGNDARAFSTFKRLLTILKLVVAQLDVIETMTPVQFLTFRERLESSSGFQSGQFRELEAILGRRDPGVLAAYHEGSVDHEKVKAAMERPSVYDSFLRYLAGKGYAIPEEVLERDVNAARGGVQGRPGSPDPGLPRRRRAGAGCRASRRLRRGLDGVALPPREDGRADDRHAARHRWGAEYLRTTLHKPFFPDLWTIRSEL